MPIRMTDGGHHLRAFGRRAHFDEAAAREVSRVRRSGASVGLLVLEIEGFERIDEDHGERLLGAVATVIAEQTRAPDLCFRWEPAEFVLLLPETSRFGATELALRIRGVCAAEHRLPGGGPLRLTAGIAELAEEQEAAGLLAAAYRDLKRARELGGVP